jgi:hypothetical protein
MAISTKIDFDNIYAIEPVGNNLRTNSFKTELAGGMLADMHIEISDEQHELFPNVYNLSFGPLNKKGRIDDSIKLTHAYYSKVFSTILLEALTYLSHNPDHYIGIDGSNNARAYLYYRFIRRNYDYLNTYFNMYGVKYYVRITRFGKKQYDNPFDFADIQSYGEKLEKDMIPQTEFMYNYFFFNLK